MSFKQRFLTSPLQNLGARVQVAKGTSLNTSTKILNSTTKDAIIPKDIAAIWNFNMYNPKSQNLITVGHISRDTS